MRGEPSQEGFSLFHTKKSFLIPFSAAFHIDFSACFSAFILMRKNAIIYVLPPCPGACNCCTIACEAWLARRQAGARGTACRHRVAGRGGAHEASATQRRRTRDEDYGAYSDTALRASRRSAPALAAGALPGLCVGLRYGVGRMSTAEVGSLSDEELQDRLDAVRAFFFTSSLYHIRACLPVLIDGSVHGRRCWWTAWRSTRGWASYG